MGGASWPGLQIPAEWKARRARGLPSTLPYQHGAHAPTPTLSAWRARGLRQARLASGEDVFGPLIRRFILDNKHRVTVEVRMWTRMCAVVRGCAAWRACLSAGLTVVCALEESRQEAVLPSLQRASGEHYKRCPLSFSDKSVCTEVTPRL